MRILIIKWVCQDANMMSLLIMELTAAIGGDLGLLANNDIVRLAWIQSDLGFSMLFDSRLRPAYSYSPARVNRALVTNGQIGTCQGCMRLSRIHNEYPYRRYEQQNHGFMTVSRQFVTAVNVLSIMRVN